MALELQSAGTLAQSRDWFWSGLPENPRMLQGEGPTRSPWRVGAGVGPALGALRVPVDPVGRFPCVVLPEAPD